MVYWVIALVVCFLVLNAIVAGMYHSQKEMRVELDKLRAWRQRVEVASTLLDKDLRELSVNAYKHMKYDSIFIEIFKAFDLYGRRLQDGQERPEGR